MTRFDPIDVTVIILADATPPAVLVDHGGKAPCWLPRSQIEFAPNSDGRTHTLTLPQWLAEEKGMV
jgi:hypothetical protein